jgi:phosphoribosylanthranilate isomerase
MTHIKICGVTSVEDAALALEAGADAIGLNFYPPSPRCISVEKAAEIRAAIPASIPVSGVFVNVAPGEIVAIGRRVGFDIAQLHGDESPADLTEVSRSLPTWKAFQVGADFAAGELEKYPDAAGYLLEAAYLAPGQYGGSGKLADWCVATQIGLSRKIMLAGGLNSDNVFRAVTQVRPFAVDVATGVEVVTGKKDRQRLFDFVREVRRADQEAGNAAQTARPS